MFLGGSPRGVFAAASMISPLWLNTSMRARSGCRRQYDIACTNIQIWFFTWGGGGGRLVAALSTLARDVGRTVLVCRCGTYELERSNTFDTYSFFHPSDTRLGPRLERTATRASQGCTWFATTACLLVSKRSSPCRGQVVYLVM